MQAQIVERARGIEQEPLRLVERSAPEPGPGQVRIRVSACGVCHTDLHIAEGDLTPPRLPIIPGHQAVGIVEKLGTDGKRLRPGDRVGVAWLHEACGRCAECARGLENLCDRARFTGFHADGGYAGAIVAPEEFVYPIPAGYTEEEAAPLLCAGIIGYRALRVSGLQSGERLALFGFGASAHLTLQVARRRGCEVFVFSRSGAHRRLALDLGASWAGAAEQAAPAPADRAILFAPAGRLIPPALRSLRKAGTLAIAAVHLDAVPAFDYRLLFEERVLRTVTASTRADGAELMAEAEQSRLRVETECFPLAAANRALRLLKEGKINGAAVLQIDS